MSSKTRVLKSANASDLFRWLQVGFWIGALGLGVLALTGTAKASDGTLNAIAYKPMPASPSFYVRPRDNSAENLVIKGQIERSLSEKGLRLAARSEADVVLTFETMDVAGAFSDGGRRHWLEVTGSATTGSSDDGAQARVNLFDSKSGGLLNQGEQEGTSITTASKVRLDMTLDVPAARERLWAGWAVAELGGTAWNKLAEAMVGPLINNLGQTVRSEKIALP
ncbi:MAG: hypothetical protein ACPGOV_04940 [Magnetovibrionaceae bacterium]